jgi:hypothetical protein
MENPLKADGTTQEEIQQICDAHVVGRGVGEMEKSGGQQPGRAASGRQASGARRDLSLEDPSRAVILRKRYGFEG